MATGPDDLPPALRRLLGEGQARVERIRDFAEDHARRHKFGEQIDAHQHPPSGFEEKIDTAVRRLEAAEQRIVEAARERLPSSPGTVNVRVELPPQPGAPPSGHPGTVDIQVPLLGRVRARGWRGVLAVALVAALLGLAWMAGSWRPPAAPTGSQAPGPTHS